jgi:hypothetical protein
MRKAWTLLGLVAVAATLAAAGCGGDDDEGETLTREEFIAQGDQNCERADKELEAAEQEAFGGLQQGERPSSAQLKQFATEGLVPNIQGQIDFLRNLNAPEADQDEVNKILDTAQEAIDDLEQDPSQLQGPAGQKLNQAGNELQQFGFKKCGR